MTVRANRIVNYDLLRIEKNVLTPLKRDEYNIFMPVQ
jgi:hypothetical protein